MGFIGSIGFMGSIGFIGSIATILFIQSDQERRVPSKVPAALASDACESSRRARTAIRRRLTKSAGVDFIAGFCASSPSSSQRSGWRKG
jgi:hypothetical protein